MVRRDAGDLSLADRGPGCVGDVLHAGGDCGVNRPLLQYRPRLRQISAADTDEQHSLTSGVGGRQRVRLGEVTEPRARAKRRVLGQALRRATDQNQLRRRNATIEQCLHRQPAEIARGAGDNNGLGKRLDLGVDRFCDDREYSAGERQPENAKKLHHEQEAPRKLAAIMRGEHTEAQRPNRAHSAQFMPI